LLIIILYYNTFSAYSTLALLC